MSVRIGKKRKAIRRVGFRVCSFADREEFRRWTDPPDEYSTSEIN